MSEVWKYFFAVSIMVAEMFFNSEDLSGLMKISMGGAEVAVSSSDSLFSSNLISGKRHSLELSPACMASLCAEDITLKAASISSGDASAFGPVIGLSRLLFSRGVGHTFIMLTPPHLCSESPGQSKEHSEVQVMAVGCESPQEQVSEFSTPANA